MATPSQQVIAATLNANAGSRWQEIYSKRAARVLAAAARPLLTVAPFGLSANWVNLDTAGFRQQTLAASPSVLEVAQDLAGDTGFKEAIDAGFAGVRLRPPTRNQLIKALQPLLSAQITPAFVAQVAGSFPLQTVWPRLADTVAAELYWLYKANPATPEAMLLQYSLVAAFFQASKLPNARAVRDRFAQIQRPSLDVRGGLLRIVQRVGASGIVEREPTDRPYQPPATTPAHRALSVVLDSTTKEAPLIGAGGGTMHRTLPLQGPVAASQPVPAGMTQQDVETARTAAWKQYDYSALIFTTIASVEFLLRSAAEQTGVRQDSVPRLAEALGLPDAHRQLIDEVFGGDDFNLRNKAMHGAFLEIESRRTEINMTLPFAPRLGIPSLNLQGDPFLPASAAATVLELLRGVEGLVAADDELGNWFRNKRRNWLCRKVCGVARLFRWLFSGYPSSWSKSYRLTRRERALARSWRDAAVLRWKNMYPQALAFLRANYPALSVPVQFGLQGWVNPAHSEDLFPQFAFLAVMLEPLARLTFHQAGLPVLQASLTTNQANQEEFDLKYLMLDKRGLLADPKVAWLKANLPAADAALVDDVLRLATKSRDAFAHGAVRTFTTDDREAYSTPIALAMMLLLSAAIKANPPAAAAPQVPPALPPAPTGSGT